MALLEYPTYFQVININCDEFLKAFIAAMKSTVRRHQEFKSLKDVIYPWYQWFRFHNNIRSRDHELCIPILVSHIKKAKHIGGIAIAYDLKTLSTKNL